MPKDRIGLGVVGLGRGFMLTLPTLMRHTGFAIVAAMDPRPEARHAFENMFGGRAHADFDALLADSKVDAVYLASPHGVHAEQAMAAAAAGKHVLVEKPMATSVRECVAMDKAAKAAGVVLVVGPSHAFDPQIDSAAEIIASGAYGRVRMLTALNFTDFMYRLRRPEELDTAMGGGVAYSQAAHHFDIARRLMGTPVRSVRAMARCWDQDRRGEGAYTALATFDDDAVATLTYSGYAHYDSDELVDWVSELGFPKNPTHYGEARSRLRALGDNDEAIAKAERGFGSFSASQFPLPAHHEHFGFIVVSCEGADLRLTPNGIWIYADHERRLQELPFNLPRAGALDEFTAAIRKERPARHDGAWGTHILACCEALLRSSRERREIDVDRHSSLTKEFL